MAIGEARRGATEPRRDVIILRVFIIAWAIATVALVAARAFRPGLEIGDGLNDADILHASNWFAEHGYTATHLLPTRETARAPGQAVRFYNTFPPGVFYFHEALRLAGLRELWAFRVASVLWAQAAVLLFYWAARLMSGSVLIATLAAVLYMCSTPYVTYSGGMWEHLPMLTLFGTLVCWWSAGEARSPRAARVWTAAAGVAIFIDSWLTVQHALMIACIIAGRAAWMTVVHTGGSERPRLARAAPVLVVCSIPLVVLCMRFVHQSVASGGVREAYDYFQQSIVLRGGFEERRVSRPQALSVCLQRLGVFSQSNEVDRGTYRVFDISNLSMLAASGACIVWGLMRGHRLGSDAVGRGVLSGSLMFCGALTWPFAMSDHAGTHSFVVLMFLPGACLGVASIVAAGPLSSWRALPTVDLARQLVLTGLGIGLFVSTIAECGRSDLINAFVRCDARVWKAVEDERKRLEIVACAGQALAPYVRVVRLSPRVPTVAYALGLPFYQVVTPTVLPFVEGEAIAVDMTRARANRAPGNLVASLGVPQALSDPSGIVVYRAQTVIGNDGAVRLQRNDRISDRASLREVRWGRTLDGAAFCLGVGIVGPLERNEVDALDVGLSVTDQSAREIHRVRKGEGVRTSIGQRGTLMLVQVPVAVGQQAKSIELTLCSGERRVSVRMDLADE